MTLLRLLIVSAVLCASLPWVAVAQTTGQPKDATANSGNPAHPDTAPAPPPRTPSRFDVLRAAYGPFRANNDLLFYHLDVRVDPIAKSIAGKNSIRFKMLSDGTRIQLDLQPLLAVDKILLLDSNQERTTDQEQATGQERAAGQKQKTELKYTRDSGAVFIDFPETLHAGHTYTIEFFYSGTPAAKGRFGGMSFGTDPAGRPWITTACEDDGSSIFWPSKDQWRDEPQQGMEISVAVPNDLMDVSNGRFLNKKNLGDGYTQWNWLVHYPINSYDVALNIGAYQHFNDLYPYKDGKTLTMDFYALPEDVDKAKVQFAQARGMIDAFSHYFGPYPFPEDGYKLVQVPYSGMEHQSAVAYGNLFANGYLKRDWTGVGISPRFDFIIIHESGHEWFGNSITAADKSDMWIHEGWTTYLETLYVEFRWGKDDALKYTSGFVPKVRNRSPIITEYGANLDPSQDQYFKAALVINTLRSIVDNDPEWFQLIHDFYQHFKYQNISTNDVVQWWNAALKQNLTPFFNQYLRRSAIPALELNFDEAHHTVLYKWQAEEPGFNMPVKVGIPGSWQTIHPTEEWQSMQSPLSRDEFSVATGLFYINVSKT